MDRRELGLAGVMPHATASSNIFENMLTDWFARDGVARSPWCSAETCERSTSLSLTQLEQQIWTERERVSESPLFSMAGF